MARAGLTPERVIDAGAMTADAVGWDSLTLQAVATRVGVKLPSLYKHVDSLASLKEAIAARALGELAAAIERAAVGRSGADALAAIAHAYRAYAMGHPGRYAATVSAPTDHSTERHAAASRTLDVVTAGLAGYGLVGEPLVHAVRAVRASLHGFVALEAAGGFGLPHQIDHSFEMVIRGLDAALRAPRM